MAFEVYPSEQPPFRPESSVNDVSIIAVFKTVYARYERLAHLFGDVSTPKGRELKFFIVENVIPDPDSNVIDYHMLLMSPDTLADRLTHSPRMGESLQALPVWFRFGYDDMQMHTTAVPRKKLPHGFDSESTVQDLLQEIQPGSPQTQQLGMVDVNVDNGRATINGLPADLVFDLESSLSPGNSLNDLILGIGEKIQTYRPTPY
jgi:hypothetical protein